MVLKMGPGAPDSTWTAICIFSFAMGTWRQFYLHKKKVWEPPQEAICHYGFSFISHNSLLISYFKGQTVTHLLGLNCADTADSGVHIGFCRFEFRSDTVVSMPFRRTGAFPSFSMMPGPSLPRVSDGAQTSNNGGPEWLLLGTWLPEDQEEVLGRGKGESSSVRNRTDFAGCGE